jgi:division protein CdvB (Snf7/Vps24/ESCRT-III family)
MNPPPPLKPRMDNAVKRIKTQITKLEQESARFNERDKGLFKKIVEAYQTHDTVHANIYANELAEIRRMAKMTLSSQMALEQVMLRIETASELGDITYTLLPVIGVMRDIRSSMSSVNPQIARELGDISNLLSGLVMDVGASSGLNINFQSANEDAQKIVEEAAVVVESRMKDTFPDLPNREKLPE